MPLQLRWPIGLSLLAVAPFLVVAAYMILTPPHIEWFPGSGIVALLAALTAGASGIVLLPLGRAPRAILMLFYLPTVGVILVFLSFVLACGLYGQCL